MCGIAWVIALEEFIEKMGKDDSGGVPISVAYETFRILRWNENRWGQGYGMTFLWDNWYWKTDKFLDISSAEVREKIAAIKGRAYAWMWHARYATSSVTSNDDLEKNLPFVSDEVIEFDENRIFCFTFNGNIANSKKIKERLQLKWKEKWIDRKFKYENYDSEVLKFMIVDLLESWISDLRIIVEEINKEIDGCCNVAILLKESGRFIASVDTHEFRPLFWGVKEGLFYYSSEEHALESRWVDSIKKLSAWEFIEVIDWRIYPWNMRLPIDPTPCPLEYIYFSNGRSLLHNNESIQRWRTRLWRTMAELENLPIEENPEAFVIVWVPDGWNPYAQGYAEFFWKKPLQAILKDQDIWKTFTASEEDRHIKLIKKYLSAFEWKAQWKKLILLDDSLVRSSTLRRLIPYIKERLKPKEIHIRICSPTINGHCPYALNIQSIEELFAPKYVKDPYNVQLEENVKMSEALGVASIRFLPLWHLHEEMVRVKVENACLACMSWSYPTPCWQREHDRQKAIFDEVHK